jgi:hypothetical protein
MGIGIIRLSIKFVCLSSLFILTLNAHSQLRAQPLVAPAGVQSASVANAQAVPQDVHRPSRNFDTPIGMFDGQSDIGSAQVPGSAGYDAERKQYIIDSAGYNAGYTRDEFRYLWKKMSGDVALAADITFPDPRGHSDRKAVLVIRQNLEDDSREAIAAVYGTGVFELAQRPRKGVAIKDMKYRIWGLPHRSDVRSDRVTMVRRISIEKHGDAFLLFISLNGEPMHAFGPPLILHMDEPFYVGIGFSSNLPDRSDRAVFSNVVIENPARFARPGSAAVPTPLPTSAIR